MAAALGKAAYGPHSEGLEFADRGERRTWRVGQQIHADVASFLSPRFNVEISIHVEEMRKESDLADIPGKFWFPVEEGI